ncbi:MAG: LytTR family DNA-binding domain-containing protein [Cyanobacteria bacterium J06649_11]
MTTAIILDDEQSAINVLEAYLRTYDVTLLGSFMDMYEAEKAIIDKRPRLLFLDIRINGEYVFSMIERLKQRQLDFAIIFVTGFYKNHLEDVIQSCQFRYHFSYLGKPVDRDFLAEKLADFRDFINSEELAYSVKKNYLITKFKSTYEKVPFADILYLESDGNYTNIYFHRNGEIRKRNVPSGLGSMVEKLPNHLFFRISARHMIYRERFSSVKVEGTNHLCLLSHPKIAEEKEIPIPEKKWRDFRAEFF